VNIGPTQLRPESVTLDADWRPVLLFLKRDGVTPEDLSASGADCTCEVSPVNSATTHVRRKSTGGTVYPEGSTSGPDGIIEFVWLQAALVSLIGAAGAECDVAYYFEKSGARRKVAEGRVTFLPALT
jgi:hypothetical protein